MINNSAMKVLQLVSASRNMAPLESTGNCKTQKCSAECMIILDDDLLISGCFYAILKEKRA
jgi:hypothetical protein